MWSPSSVWTMETALPLRNPLEHLFGINKVDAVFLEVHAPFPRIPSDH